jgi:hypothetical protein
MLILLRSFSREGLRRDQRRILRVYIEEIEVVSRGDDALYAIIEIIGDGDIRGGSDWRVVGAVTVGVTVTVAVGAVGAVAAVVISVAGLLAIVVFDVS